ncbi:MAG: SH3 domain-containing protein [Lacunisphaera sp.]|nr:SH3 domain-containing protein [Lacunisphaera sp.]
MKSRPTPRVWLAVILLVLSVSVEAALVAGGLAYTKRFKTILLAEPSPLAAPAGELALGRKLTLNEVRGSWLRVSDGPATGWVFAGNLSETKPEEAKGADGLPLAASLTTAAARPLTPAAADYAERRNLDSAREDLDWLLEECKAFTPEEVAAFLQVQKKGEYQ